MLRVADRVGDCVRLAIPRAATTTLQWVEGKKSLRPCPFPAWVFTSAVCIKTAEYKQAREKSYDSVQRAFRNPFVQGKRIIMRNH